MIVIGQKELKKQIKDLKVGDTFRKQDGWDDTFLTVVKINNNKTKVRYKFIQIDGNLIHNSSLYEMNVNYLLNSFYYEKTEFNDEKIKIKQPKYIHGIL